MLIWLKIRPLRYTIFKIFSLIIQVFHYRIAHRRLTLNSLIAGYFFYHSTKTEIHSTDIAPKVSVTRAIKWSILFNVSN